MKVDTFHNSTLYFNVIQAIETWGVFYQCPFCPTI